MWPQNFAKNFERFLMLGPVLKMLQLFSSRRCLFTHMKTSFEGKKESPQMLANKIGMKIFWLNSVFYRCKQQQQKYLFMAVNKIKTCKLWIQFRRFFFLLTGIADILKMRSSLNYIQGCSWILWLVRFELLELNIWTVYKT